MLTIGLKHIVVLGEQSDSYPSLAAFNGRLWMSWTGTGNKQLNVMGATLDPNGHLLFDQATKQVMGDTSPSSPPLAVFKDRLWMAWRGDGNDQLNVMGATQGNNFDSNTKQIMGDTSPSSPSLAVFNDRLWMAWRGEGNNQLNVMGATQGNNFDSNTKQVMGDTSEASPALCVHDGKLWIGWQGVNNHQLNLMSATQGNNFDSNTKIVYQTTFSLDSPGLTSSGASQPTLASLGGKLFVSVMTGDSFTRSWILVEGLQGTTFDDTVARRIAGGGLIFAIPSIAVFQNRLFGAWSNADTTNVLTVQQDHQLNISEIVLF